MQDWPSRVQKDRGDSRTVKVVVVMQDWPSRVQKDRGDLRTVEYGRFQRYAISFAQG